MSGTFLQVCLSYVFLWKKMTSQHGKGIHQIPASGLGLPHAAELPSANFSAQTSCRTAQTAHLWHWSAGLFLLGNLSIKKPDILISKAGQGERGCGNWSCRAHRSRWRWAHIVSQSPGDGLLAPVCAVHAVQIELYCTCQSGRSNICHEH